MEEQRLPEGFSMALAQNRFAMQNFVSMPEVQRSAVIEQSRRAKTKREMQYLVSRIADWKVN